MRFLIALAAMAVAATPALARNEPGGEGEARETAAYRSCLDQAVSTPDMTGCMAAEYEVQDKALNAAYAKAMDGLNARQKEKLKTAQRAWIAFRDANCRALQDEDWGTLSRVTAMSCMVRMTIERTIELEDYPPE